MKIGVSIKIDVTKIDKSRLFQGEKGTYLDATAFIDTEHFDQYGNSGMIVQDWKDKQKGEGAILGNTKVFWQGESRQPEHTKPPSEPDLGDGHKPADGFDEDIPFIDPYKFNWHII